MGVDFLKVYDMVIGWVIKEGFGLMGVVVVLLIEFWFIIVGFCLILFVFIVGFVVFCLLGGWMRKWCFFLYFGF